MRRRIRWLALVALLGVWACHSWQRLNVEHLSPSDTQRLQAVLRALEPLITARKQAGTANVLTWDELYQPLPDDERAFLNAFRALKAEHLGATSHYFGEDRASLDLVKVGPWQLKQHGKPLTVDQQVLPRPVHEAYEAMMRAMERDLGRRLLVESGYRAPAYQLYLFMFYLPKHGYSIRETNRFVALPGYSEHGYPPRQAIDFINQQGINGEDHPEEFEALPEYAWLRKHANEFGFFLSYPRENISHTAFEPWHWHHEAR